MTDANQENAFWVVISELLIFPKIILFIIPLFIFLSIPFISNDYSGILENNINSIMPNKHKFIADFTAIHFFILVLILLIKILTVGLSNNAMIILRERFCDDSLINISLSEFLGGISVILMYFFSLFLMSGHTKPRAEMFASLHSSTAFYFIINMIANYCMFMLIIFLIISLNRSKY